MISRDGDDRQLFTLLAEGEVDDFLYTGKAVQTTVATSRGPATLGDVRQRTLPRPLSALVLRDVHVVRNTP